MPTFKYRTDERAEAVRVTYATETELLDFSNRVRQAGGGDALKALFPSTPSKSSACLIANALNFECRVSGSDLPGTPELTNAGVPVWFMQLPREVATKVAQALDLTVYHSEFESQPSEVQLPQRIGNTALAFDCGVGWTARYIKEDYLKYITATGVAEDPHSLLIRDEHGEVTGVKDDT